VPFRVVPLHREICGDRKNGEGVDCGYFEDVDELSDAMSFGCAFRF
jgi:hypothetical protein